MKSVTAEAQEAVQAKREAVQAQLLEAVRGATQAETELKADEESRRQSDNARRVAAAARAEFDRWNELNDLIGSEDGAKFVRFAQALTFRRLLHFANEELGQLSRRYVLEPAAGDPLDFQVVDNSLNCLSRSATNLSGGESFLVSLALALGLSRMSSGGSRQSLQVDTVFLDEGFGTLDLEMLERALFALSELRNQGKLVGVISHIEEVGQKIPVRIEVKSGSAGRPESDRRSGRYPGLKRKLKKQKKLSGVRPESFFLLPSGGEAGEAEAAADGISVRVPYTSVPSPNPSRPSPCPS